jgi:hypothetical protein
VIRGSLTVFIFHRNGLIHEAGKELIAAQQQKYTEYAC